MAYVTVQAIIVTTLFLTILRNCIVLYRIMKPYTEGQLDRYRIGIPRLSEGSLTCHHMSPQGTHHLIARRRNSITSVLVTIS